MIHTIIQKTRTVINNPVSVPIKLLNKLSPLIPDRAYLKMLFPLEVGYKLNLENPQTFNEKLQWLKLNYRKRELTRMVDKYEAKGFAAELIGEEYIVKNYGVWDSFDDIDFDSLPNQFVLKTTHDQGGVVICKDKSKFDYEKARKKLTKHLKFKHYYLTREWPYKNVKPRILAEELLIETKLGDIWDYKFYCFNGVPKIMLIATDRSKGDVRFDYFDMNFNIIDLQQGGKRSDRIFEKPENFDLMISLASKLSVGLPHVRVDFYDINGKVLFGEMTFFDSGGMARFTPIEWDYTLGNWIDLSQIKIEN